MNEQMKISTDFTDQIRQTARQLVYPPTPDLTRRLYDRLDQKQVGLPGRELAWRVILLVVILLAGSLLVPSVRAAVLEFLQLGGIRIFLATPTPEGLLLSPDSTLSPAPIESLFSHLELSGAITMKDALERFPHRFEAPANLPKFGEPDRVYLQHRGGYILVMVWLGADERVQLSLLILEEGAFVSKESPSTIVETEVDGLPALWLEGEHYLILDASRQAGAEAGLDPDFIQVKGNVLIWEENGLTYRLETWHSLEFALNLAESMQMFP